MAKCAICGKGVHFGNNVSHSHRRSNHIWKPNIKSVRVKVEGGRVVFTLPPCGVAAVTVK